MEQYVFSNNNIDLACRETGKFLLTSGVDRREALRIKLTLEEILLKYQRKFGEDSSFKVRLIKRLSAIKVEIIVCGESYDAISPENEEDDILHSLLTGIGLAPSWNYKYGKNYVTFTPKKKPLSGTTKMISAIVLAVIAGVMLNFLPGGIRNNVNDYILTPITDILLGLISAVAGSLIFLSVLGSICAMGNMETLAVNAIMDFPCTACNVSGWQLTMIDVADSLNMLDREVFYRD